MQQTIIYKTSYFQDKFQLFREGLKMGTLYKSNWLGSTIETTVNNKRFKFVSKGIINRVITILDKNNDRNIGEVSSSAFLRFHPTAILTLEGSKKYKWEAGGWITSHWKWVDIDSSQVVMNADDQLYVFKNSGAISTDSQDSDQELLIGLGIHLRSNVPRGNKISFLFGLVILAIFLSKLFSP